MFGNQGCTSAFSKSKHKEDIERERERERAELFLLTNVQIIKIPHLLEKKKRRSKATDEEGPSLRNENDLRFTTKELFAYLQPPDLSMLNLHHSCPIKYLLGMVLFKPVCGMIFIPCILLTGSNEPMNFIYLLRNTLLIFSSGYNLIYIQRCSRRKESRSLRKERKK